MDVRAEDLRGRRLAHYMWDELEKIANGVAPGSAPSQATTSSEQSGELEGGIQRESEGVEEASPSHGVVASRVEQLGDKKARGTPILQPPPGFIYDPEHQAFVPNPQDPGWMNVQQQQAAQHNKGWYDKGQQDIQQGQAQQELDTQVQQQTQEAEQQQATDQQQQQAQVQAQQAAPQMQAQAQAKEQAKAQAKSTVGGLKTPKSVKDEKSSPKKSPTSAGKGVTIKIGK